MKIGDNHASRSEPRGRRRTRSECLIEMSLVNVFVIYLIFLVVHGFGKDVPGFYTNQLVPFSEALGSELGWSFTVYIALLIAFNAIALRLQSQEPTKTVDSAMFTMYVVVNIIILFMTLSTGLAVIASIGSLDSRAFLFVAAPVYVVAVFLASSVGQYSLNPVSQQLRVARTALEARRENMASIGQRSRLGGPLAVLFNISVAMAIIFSLYLLPSWRGEPFNWRTFLYHSIVVLSEVILLVCAVAMSSALRRGGELTRDLIIFILVSSFAVALTMAIGADFGLLYGLPYGVQALFLGLSSMSLATKHGAFARDWSLRGAYNRWSYRLELTAIHRVRAKIDALKEQQNPLPNRSIDPGNAH